MSKPEIPFDMEAALKALREGQSLTGKDGILTPLIKQLTEAAIQAELDKHLAEEDAPNCKNGKSSKTVNTLSGRFELNTPRDRANSFEPQLVKKNQTQLTDDLERKIIALFALGTSYQDICSHIVDLYGISVSNGTIMTDSSLIYRPGGSVIWKPFIRSSGSMPSTIKSRRTTAISARRSTPSSA